MTRYEEEAAKVAQTQREAGWNEEDIAWYAGFQRTFVEMQTGLNMDHDDLPEGMHLGASLS